MADEYRKVEEVHRDGDNRPIDPRRSDSSNLIAIAVIIILLILAVLIFRGVGSRSNVVNETPIPVETQSVNMNINTPSIESTATPASTSPLY